MTDVTLALMEVLARKSLPSTETDAQSRKRNRGEEELQEKKKKRKKDHKPSASEAPPEPQPEVPEDTVRRSNLDLYDPSITHLCLAFRLFSKATKLVSLKPKPPPEIMYDIFSLFSLCRH